MDCRETLSHVLDRIGRFRRTWLQRYWWVSVLFGFTVVFGAVGLIMIDEAWYFGMEKAFRFDRLAKDATTTDERVGFQVAAGGSRGIAGMYSAVAAACFSFISIVVGWAGLLYSIRSSNSSSVTVRVDTDVTESANADETRSKRMANHQLSEFADEDDLPDNSEQLPDHLDDREDTVADADC